MPENDKAPEGRATARLRKRLEPLLNGWYGQEDALSASELVKHLPRAATLGDALNSVMRKKIPSYRLVVSRLQTKWTEIAGAAAAKHTMPVRFQNGVLDIEVSHPAYRAALSSKTIREMILGNIRKVLGDDSCREFRFIPAGSRPPDRTV